jgi:hypothetical protein
MSFSSPWARAWDGHEVVALAVGRLALHHAEENPGDVVAALDDRSRPLLRQQGRILELPAHRRGHSRRPACLRGSMRNGPRGLLELDESTHVRRAQTLCRDQARHGAVGETSARIANSRNAVIGACLRRSSLWRVGRRIGIRVWLFLFTKPWRQVFQRGLSVADRCLEHRKTICALRSGRRNSSRIIGRFPDGLNRLRQHRRRQGNYHHQGNYHYQWNYHHQWSDMHGLSSVSSPFSESRYSICPCQVLQRHEHLCGVWTEGVLAMAVLALAGSSRRAHGVASTVGHRRAATAIRRQP